MQKQPNMGYKIQIEPCEFSKTSPVHYFMHNPETQQIVDVDVHDFLEIGYCVSGSGVFLIDDQLLPFYKGDVVVIFKRQVHKAQSSQCGSEWYFLYIDIDAIVQDFSMEELLIVQSIVQEPSHYNSITNKHEIADAVISIVTELAKREKNYNSRVKSLVWSLVIQLDRELAKPEEEIIQGANSSHILKLSTALDYISKNYNSEITVTSLATHSLMSPSSLRREFASTMKMSPLEYITLLRIKMATILINTTDKAICDIAFEVGFSSLSSFNRKFKEIIQCSPTKFKQLNRD